MFAGTPAQRKRKGPAAKVDPLQAIADIDTSNEGGPQFVPGASETDLGSNRFKLEVDFIKALPVRVHSKLAMLSYCMFRRSYSKNKCLSSAVQCIGSCVGYSDWLVQALSGQDSESGSNEF
jgi:hypothetical protein